MKLYKYRSLDNLEYTLDIIVNSRLYAATYETLNDPMEGHFRYRSKKIGRSLLDEIRSMKKETRIVSLVQTPNDMLMWSYYAGGHSGVVIGVEIKKNSKHTIKEVQYKANGPYIKGNSSVETAVEKLLSTKYSVWEHEEEVRVLTQESYIKVRVDELIFGKNISRTNKSLLTKIARKFGITNIRKLKRRDLKEFA